MHESEQPISLPLATIEAIVTAANANAPLSPESMEGLRVWLSKATTRAIHVAKARPVTRKNVDDLEKAYRRFRAVIEGLQDTSHPPPRIPILKAGVTAWEHWLGGYQEFGFKPGRRPDRDWRLITKLIVLYENLSGKRASAANNNNPTMKFLDTALIELAKHVPPELHDEFVSLNAETLDNQIDYMLGNAFRVAASELAKAIGERGVTIPPK